MGYEFASDRIDSNRNPPVTPKLGRGVTRGLTRILGFLLLYEYDCEFLGVWLK